MLSKMFPTVFKPERSKLLFKDTVHVLWLPVMITYISIMHLADAFFQSK